MIGGRQKKGPFMTSDHHLLKERLDHLYRNYHASYLYSDPLKYLHLYERKEDQEMVGIITACLAYGRVDRIFRSVEQVLEMMGPSPSDFISRFDPRRDGGPLREFVHRFNKGEDVACLIWFMRQIQDKHGSLGNLFRHLSDKQDDDVKEMLIAFSEYVLSLDASPFYGGRGLPREAGVRFFFPSPVKGSPCKRLNLFLRWMVRRNDGLDLGLWEFISPARLIMPIDTHIARLSMNLGLTSRKQASWQMALEVTENLKKLNSEDPLRYDFALCRLGILDLCPQRKNEEKCRSCSIGDLCVRVHRAHSLAEEHGAAWHDDGGTGRRTSR